MSFLFQYYVFADDRFLFLDAGRIRQNKQTYTQTHTTDSSFPSLRYSSLSRTSHVPPSPHSLCLHSNNAHKPEFVEGSRFVIRAMTARFKYYYPGRGTPHPSPTPFSPHNVSVQGWGRFVFFFIIRFEQVNHENTEKEERLPAGSEQRVFRIRYGGFTYDKKFQACGVIVGNHLLQAYLATKYIRLYGALRTLGPCTHLCLHCADTGENSLGRGQNLRWLLNL